MNQKEFIEISRIDHLTGISAQGVTYDGTYAYLILGNSIVKYNLTTGAIIATHSTVSDGTYGAHLGDATYSNGKLYVLGDNYPNTPGKVYVMTYDPGTLAFESEIDLTDTPAAGAITYRDGSFWVCEDKNLKVTQYDLSFVKVADFTATEPKFYGVNHKWNGIEKVGDTFYLNPHEGVYPSNVQTYEIDGSALVFKGTLLRPSECTQGMHWREDTQDMLFALRHYVQPYDGIVTTKLAVDDYRTEIPGYASPNSITSTHTSYAEEPSLSVKVNAKRGDLIKVEFVAIFKSSSGGSIRAYMDVASASTTQASMVNNSPTLRTNTTSSDGVTLSNFKLFRADADGVVTFSVVCKITSGTATIGDPALFAQVIGKTL